MGDKISDVIMHIGEKKLLNIVSGIAQQNNIDRFIIIFSFSNLHLSFAGVSGG